MNSMQTEFEQCVFNNNPKKLIEILKNEDIDPSKDNSRVLVHACMKNYTKIAELLLIDKRVDPSAQMNHSLKVMACHGNVKIVDLLLKDKRVNPNDKYILSSLFNKEFFNEEHMEVTKLFFKHPNLEPTTDHALHYAAQLGIPEIIEMLFQYESARNELKEYFPKLYKKHFTAYFKNKIEEF